MAGSWHRVRGSGGANTSFAYFYILRKCRASSWACESRKPPGRCGLLGHARSLPHSLSIDSALLYSCCRAAFVESSATGEL
eukprot:scaffold257444_cov41-Tisochrysis_lutea.AAC.3